MSDLQSLNLNNPHILNFKKSPEKISLYFDTLFGQKTPTFLENTLNGHLFSKMDDLKKYMIKVKVAGHHFWTI